MQFITNAQELSSIFIELVHNYANVAFATAWASAEHLAFNSLLKNQKKIKHSAIGLHFYQTDPEVLEQFQQNKNIKFILQTDGVFHPKLYLFWNKKNDWALLSGSANFTKGAFNGNNQEIMFLTKGQSADFFESLISFLRNDCFVKGESLNAEYIKRYKTLYQKRRQSIYSLSNIYPNGNKNSVMKKNILSVDILTYSWESYFNAIKKDKYHAFENRLELLDFSRKTFEASDDFQSIELEARKLISGLPNSANTGLEYGWFGSTNSNGKFSNKINNSNQEFAQAIDSIPLTGVIGRDEFLEYNRMCQKAGYKNPIGVSTRLLAMKRPDLFFCFNGANKEKICKELGLSKSLNAEQYWDEILQRIYDTPWFNSRQPIDPIESNAWQGRVALIDCIYYNPKSDK